MNTALDIAADGARIAITVRGMAAIEAAERGADLWSAAHDGWHRIRPELRASVLKRARNPKAKVAVALFGSTGNPD
jgi:hypothetical protein